MVQEPEVQDPWEELARLSEEGSPERIESFLADLPDGSVPMVLTRMDHEDRNRVLTAIDPEVAADLVEQLPIVHAVEAIEGLEPKTAAAILDELPSDEQADLIGELGAADAAAILDQMDPDEAAHTRVLVQYPDEVAGGLMVTEFLRYPETHTVGDVVIDMRSKASEYRDYDVQYTYVVDSDEKLTGVLRLRDLLLAEETQPVSDIMIRNPLSVPAEMPLEDLADLFDRHHYLGVPVSDAEGRLIGVVQKAAVDEAWGERQDNDYMKSQGIVGEEIRTMPVSRRASRRLAWLSINIVLNIIAASVIALFQGTLEAVIALAVFLPIISDMSGCSGNQAVAVSLRELSLGLVRPTELLRVWLKEVSVGLINGTVLGILIAGVAWLWQGNPYLGLVVGVALCANTIVAVSLGGLVPLILKRAKVDPAIASGPILTTVTDMCGFFFVLGLASLMVARLVPGTP